MVATNFGSASEALGGLRSAAERSNERAARKDDTSRQLTGPYAPMQAGVAGGEGMIIRLTPKTSHPAGNYNHGGCYSNADISGQTLTLRGGPCLTYWNVELLNWQDNPALRAWQGRLDAMSCGSGSGAALEYPAVPCTSASNCTTAYGEVGASCALGICRPAWRNLTRLDGFGQVNDGCDPAIWDFFVNPSGVSYFGTHAPDQPENELFCALNDVGQVEYGGTLALEVPEGARGTYTISWADDDTFYTGPDLNVAPVLEVPGVLHVPAGSCCFGLNTQSPGCMDNLVKTQCDALIPGTHWVDGGLCLSPPSAAGCGLCQLSGQCNDQNVCTTEVCVDNRCGYRAAEGPCDDGDACTIDGQCSQGACQETAIPCCGEPDGASCDDGVFCTDQDQCLDEECVGGESPCLAAEWCHEVDGQCELLGDFNGDGIIDLTDHVSLAICLLGPEFELAGDCRERFDFDGDGNVDMFDAAEFVNLFSGL